MTLRDDILTAADAYANDQAQQAATAATAAQAQLDQAQITALQAQLADVATRLGNLPPTDWSDLPMVKYGDLYQSGDTASTVLGKRVTRLCYIDMSDVDAELVDFTQANYSAYAPNVAGLWSPGPSHARLRLRPGSSTKAALVPAQKAGGTNPLACLRFGPNNAKTGRAVKLSGLTLEGSDQPPAFGHPHCYSGLVDYWGRGSIFENLLLRGFGRADWNSPPGETTPINTAHSVGSVFRNVEVDGRDATTGQRVSGGTGGGAYTNLTWIDSYIHDSLVSGFAFGASGSGPNQQQGVGLTTIRCRVASNANHSTGPGQRFRGINHEGCAGYVHHYQPDIWIDNQPTVGIEHFVFANSVADCPDIRIIDPIWHGDRGGSPTWANGCLVIGVPDQYAGAANKQTTLPYVELAGVTLTPVEKGQPADPTRNWIRIH